MKTLTFKIQLSDYQSSDSQRAVVLRITYDRQRKYYPIGVKVRNTHFKDGKVIPDDSAFKRKNLLIQKAKTKIEQIILDYQLKDKDLTLAEFEKNYLNDYYGSQSFYDFVQSEKPFLESKLSPATVQFWNKGTSKLKKFRPVLRICDIDIAFIHAYEQYMIKTLGNNENTINSSLSFLKRVINRAITQGLISDNPFKFKPIKRVEGSREHLSISQVKQLDNLYWEGTLAPSLNKVLRYFLFCCYTGLRYSDIKNLRFFNIEESKDKKGRPFKILSVDMHKTGKPVRVVLISEAERLLPETGFSHQKVFKVSSNQPVNRNLKEIMTTEKINKVISFHCARHTLAMNALEMGLTYEQIGDILGHTDIKTTRIYAKYKDLQRKEAMQKMKYK